MPVLLRRASKPIRGKFVPPPDKSISHRAVLLSALAPGITRVRGLLAADDVNSSLALVRALGVSIGIDGAAVVLESPGRCGLHEPEGVIDCGNSGTTMRLGAGLLAGLPFTSFLTGDDSLRNRPMQRIIEPLNLMGIKILSRRNGLPPLAVEGGAPRSIDYAMKIASAQVKSAVLLAGLSGEAEVSVFEPAVCRDHTERMLTAMGADIRRVSNRVTVKPVKALSPIEMDIPGDISSAAFFILAAALVPGSRLIIEKTGMNPTRTGFIDVLRRMGAGIEILNRRETGHEPVADLAVKSTKLEAVTVSAEQVPSFIDEVMLVALAATQAEGSTVIEGLSELRVKECDRLEAVYNILSSMGASARILEHDALEITGPTTLNGADLSSFGDHRIAMVCAVAALIANGPCSLDDPGVVGVSFPSFFKDLDMLLG